MRKHLPLFQLLAQSAEQQRAILLRSLSEGQLKAVLEATYNVLKGTCPVLNRDKNNLLQYRGIIRRLVSKELSPKQQRRLLTKHRDLLPIILNPVIRFLKDEH